MLAPVLEPAAAAGGLQTGSAKGHCAGAAGPILDLALSSAAADGPAWTHLPWPAMSLIGQRLAAAPQAIGMGRGVCSTWNVTLAEAVNLLAPSKFSCRSTEIVAPGAQAACGSARASFLVSSLHVVSCSQHLAWQLLGAVGCVATVARPAGTPRVLLQVHEPPGAVSELLHVGSPAWPASGFAAAAQPLCCPSAARPAGSLT